MDGVRSLTGYGFYWDPTYILVIIGAVLCLIASAKVKLSYKKIAAHTGDKYNEMADKLAKGALQA